jgi:cytochrome P450
LHIITQPKVYATLQSEIDEAVRRDRISNPIRDVEARELPYLNACIREGLRIWPPAPSDVPKVVPVEGDVLAGKFIPGGTQVGICLWGIQRHKGTFGEDAEMFRPERWLEASREQLARMEKANDLVFGHGRYQCLGKPIAMLELRKVFVEVRSWTRSIKKENRQSCHSGGWLILKIMNSSFAALISHL